MDEKNPPERFEVLIPDLHGIFRGSLLPREDFAEEISWASSVFSGRFDGSVAEECDYSFRNGDPDYPCRLHPGSDVPVPWRKKTRQGIYFMRAPDGAPFAMDPWTVLAGVLQKFTADGITPILATEFEFYLGNDTLQERDGRAGVADLYSVDEVARREKLLLQITAAAAAQNVPTANIVSEYAAGQWEINLRHAPAADACLHGLLLRRIVRAVAAQNGQRATFMAKPYSGASGSGMHIHLSLWKDNKNIFADDKLLQNAVAGALQICNEGMAFFAPWGNSYRRFVPGSYAPLSAGWAAENRAAAVRLPRAKTDAEKRIEFRLCGADANPVLAAAALLAGIHHGLQSESTPPPEQQGATPAGAPLPPTWRAALDALATAKILPKYISPKFIRHYAKVKESEWRHRRAYVCDYDKHFYGWVV